MVLDGMRISSAAELISRLERGRLNILSCRHFVWRDARAAVTATATEAEGDDAVTLMRLKSRLQTATFDSRYYRTGMQPNSQTVRPAFCGFDLSDNFIRTSFHQATRHITVNSELPKVLRPVSITQGFLTVAMAVQSDISKRWLYAPLKQSKKIYGPEARWTNYRKLQCKQYMTMDFDLDSDF